MTALLPAPLVLDALFEVEVLAPDDRTQPGNFDYGLLEGHERALLEQREWELDGLVHSGLENKRLIGKVLLDVRQRLEPTKQWTPWLNTVFPHRYHLTPRMGNNFIRFYEYFRDLSLADLKIADGAAYYIASPSVPRVAFDEVIEVAQNGEVTLEMARAIVHKHRPTPMPLALGGPTHAGLGGPFVVAPVSPVGVAPVAADDRERVAAEDRERVAAEDRERVAADAEKDERQRTHAEQTLAELRHHNRAMADALARGVTPAGNYLNLAGLVRAVGGFDAFVHGLGALKTGLPVPNLPPVWFEQGMTKEPTRDLTSKGHKALSHLQALADVLGVTL